MHLNCIYHEDKLNGNLSNVESDKYLLSSYSLSSLTVARCHLLPNHEQNPKHLRLNSHLFGNSSLHKQPLNLLITVTTSPSVPAFSGFASLHLVNGLPVPSANSKKSSTTPSFPFLSHSSPKNESSSSPLTTGERVQGNPSPTYNSLAANLPPPNPFQQFINSLIIRHVPMHTLRIHRPNRNTTPRPYKRRRSLPEQPHIEPVRCHRGSNEINRVIGYRADIFNSLSCTGRTV